MKSFRIWIRRKCHFKDISYLELWQPFCSVEWNHLCNFGRGYYEEEFCEMILNLDQWLWRKCCLKIFLILNHLCNFGRVHHEEQFCEII